MADGSAKVPQEEITFVIITDLAHRWKRSIGRRGYYLFHHAILCGFHSRAATISFSAAHPEVRRKFESGERIRYLRVEGTYTAATQNSTAAHISSVPMCNEFSASINFRIKQNTVIILCSNTATVISYSCHDFSAS